MKRHGLPNYLFPTVILKFSKIPYLIHAFAMRKNPVGKVQWRSYMQYTAQSTAVRALFLTIGRLKDGQLSEGEYPTVVVFMAFAIEAYLNTLGSRHISFWDEIERLPWRKKVHILHQVAGAQAKWDKGSLQFAAKVFQIRDQLAHGKPERVCSEWRPGTPDGSHRSHYPELKPSLHSVLTSDWLLDSADKFRVLMTYLGDLFGHHESDHLSNAEGGFEWDDGID
jgi:hypothetical protein